MAMKSKHYRYHIALGVLFLCASMTLFASGFQTWLQSGKSYGDGAAGAAAEANDPTTAFYNPAGLINIKRQDAAFSLLGRISNRRFSGTVTPSPAITGFNGAGNVQGGSTRAIPTIFYAAPISDQWGFGFSFSTPFEANSEYGRNDLTRYIITQSDLYTLDIGPSVAYSPIKPLSFGFGIDAQYLRVVYNQVDTTGATTANDATNKNTLSDWSFGWNTGLLWNITDNTRAGISYRSHMNHHATGDSKYMSTRGRAKLHINLPTSTIFSLYHAFNNKFSMMGTATYTQWQSMGTLNITGAEGPSGSNNIDVVEKLKNSWRFILGSDYQLTDIFMIRGSVGYDESPVKDRTRTLILPDTNRYLVSAGLGYKINETMSVDMGYTHAFAQHKTINHTQAYGSETLTTSGSIYNSDDYIGAQFNWLMT